MYVRYVKICTYAGKAASELQRDQQDIEAGHVRAQEIEDVDVAEEATPSEEEGQREAERQEAARAQGWKPRKSAARAAALAGPTPAPNPVA